jgi:hypothetical protein
MADKDIALRMRVDGKEADQSVKSFKQQLRESQQELLKIQERFGPVSKEALAAAKQVAALRDQMKEAKEVADLFDPGNKFMVFGNAIRTVTGGFAGLQGAMALFGSQSEELQQTMVKLQGAMALTQGVSTILDSAKDFQRLGAIIKTQVVTAFSTLRGAMMATGIGALVVAVGALVTNFGGLRDAAYKLVPGLESVVGWFGKAFNAVTDFLGITSEASRQLAADISATEARVKQAERFLDLNADKYDQFTQRKFRADVDYQKKRAELLKDETLTEQQRNDLIKQAYEQRNRTIRQADADRNEGVLKAQKDLYDKQLERQMQIDQAKKDAENKAFEEELARLYERAKRRGEAEVIAETQLREIRLAEEKKLQEERQAMADLDKGRIGEVLSITKSALLEEIKAKDDATKQKAIQAQIEVDNERQRNNHLINLSMMLSDVVGQQTAAGKALAVAASTINTYQAASEALKANYGIFGPAAQVARIVTVAAVIAQGLANVKRIIQTQVPGRAGGGGGGIALPSAATALPTSAIAPTASATAVNEELLNRTGNAAFRAYVLETDNITGQERLQRIQRAARLE